MARTALRLNNRWIIYQLATDPTPRRSSRNIALGRMCCDVLRRDLEVKVNHERRVVAHAGHLFVRTHMDADNSLSP